MLHKHLALAGKLLSCYYCYYAQKVPESGRAGKMLHASLTDRVACIGYPCLYRLLLVRATLVCTGRLYIKWVSEALALQSYCHEIAMRMPRLYYTLCCTVDALHHEAMPTPKAHYAARHPSDKGQVHDEVFS